VTAVDGVRRPGSQAPASIGRRVTGGKVPTRPWTVYERRDGVLAPRSDLLAVEEPLEIRLGQTGDGAASTLSVTMRTPGHDFELVAGFLLGEGAISGVGDVKKIAYCLDGTLEPEQRYNVVTAELTVPPRRAGLERHVVTSSACGICGSASIDAVRLAGHPDLGAGPHIDVGFLAGLPLLLAGGQRGFAETGGLHGAALVAADGAVLALREDVGRHNAVDKVIGWALLNRRLPLVDVVLIVSGRVSFEIVQKALRAGVPVVAAVSAATSLAARLADEVGMTLVGFVRGERCTVYAGRQRISFDPITGAGSPG
jgi:FdhD protein